MIKTSYAALKIVARPELLWIVKLKTAYIGTAGGGLLLNPKQHIRGKVSVTLNLECINLILWT